MSYPISYEWVEWFLVGRTAARKSFEEVVIASRIFNSQFHRTGLTAAAEA